MDSILGNTCGYDASVLPLQVSSQLRTDTDQSWLLYLSHSSLASFGGAGGQHACEIGSSVVALLYRPPASLTLLSPPSFLLSLFSSLPQLNPSESDESLSISTPPSSQLTVSLSPTGSSKLRNLRRSCGTSKNELGSFSDSRSWMRFARLV